MKSIYLKRRYFWKETENFMGLLGILAIHLKLIFSNTWCNFVFLISLLWLSVFCFTISCGFLLTPVCVSPLSGYLKNLKWHIKGPYGIFRLSVQVKLDFLDHLIAIQISLHSYNYLILNKKYIILQYNAGLNTYFCFG